MYEEINIGDKVRFLNDIGGGTVTGFQKGGIVLVEDADGFEIPVRVSEVCLVSDSEKRLTRQYNQPRQVEEEPEKPAYRVKTILAQPKSSEPTAEDLSRLTTSFGNAKQAAPATPAAPSPTPSSTPTETLEERVVRLEMTVRKLQMRLERLEDAKALREKVKAEDIQRKEAQRKAKDDILEVDLHAEALLETTAGMSPADIKEYQLDIFSKTIREHLTEKGRRIVFIHGNGEGVLRKALLGELRRSFKSCEYQDASFQQYGFGATMVIIH